MSMTETLFTSKSKTVKNSNNSQTLKTVIPSSIRDVLNLTAHDELNSKIINFIVIFQKKKNN